MPRGWSTQSGDDLDDYGRWLWWREAHLARRDEADAVARNLWNQSTQNGEDLYAGNPSDLTSIGLAALDRSGSYPTTTTAGHYGGDDGAFDPIGAPDPRISTSADVGGPLHLGTSIGNSLQRTSTSLGQSLVPDSSASAANDPWVSELEVTGPPRPAPDTDVLDSLDRNPLVRGAAGAGGYAIGLPWGALRAGWHALEGLGHGLNFAGGLLSSPQVRARAWDDAQTATHDALQYGRSVLANPSRIAGDALSAAEAANRDLNPFATQIPSTASGAFLHELGIGANGGEALTNVAGLLAAPEVFGGIRAARTFAATREANIAEMRMRGLDEATARDLSRRYDGQGDHALIQNSKKSILGFSAPWLKQAPIPEWFMDSSLNVSKPRGLSQYDFYKYHYAVDPKFYGGSLRRGLNGGRGFSGAQLGFERYSIPERTWARIPPIWKDYYTGVTLGDALRPLPQDLSENPQ